jgi:hypothetical protein
MDSTHSGSVEPTTDGSSGSKQEEAQLETLEPQEEIQQQTKPQILTQRGSTSSSVGPPSLSHSLTNTPSVGAESPFPDNLGKTTSGRWSFAVPVAPNSQQEALSSASEIDSENKTTAGVNNREDPAGLPNLLRPPVPTLKIDKTAIINPATLSPRHPDIDIISSQAEQILLRAKHQLTVSI